jgi:hypothetical protein
MQTLTFDQCVTRAWADTWRIARQNPLYATLAIATFYFTGVARDSLHASPTHASAGTLLELGALWLFRLLIVHMLIVQTQRYVLLDERPINRHAFFGGAFWRSLALNYGLMIGMFIGVIVIYALTRIAHHFVTLPSIGKGGIAVNVCIVIMVWVWLCTRFGLLLTQAAIGRPLRWKAGLRDTHGHCWTIIGTNVVLAITAIFGFLVLLIPAVVFRIVFGANSEHAIEELLGPVFIAVGLTADAACSAWIYRRFAANLSSTQPVDHIQQSSIHE